MTAPAARLHIEQKITPFANRYRVRHDDNGRPGGLAGFVKQKRMALREQFTVFSDENATQPVLHVRADRVFDVRASYSVVDAATGEKVGTLRKKGRASLLRSTWELDQPGMPTVTVTESSLVIAILRRVWGMLPYAGAIPMPWVFHFDGTAPDGTTVLTHTRRWGIRDRYVLESWHPALDLRLAIALGICLDALQHR